MKRKFMLILLVLAVGAISWGVGRFTHPGFEVRVEVSESGAIVTSSEGCSWTRMFLSRDEGTYAFEVNEGGVRSLGQVGE